MAIRFWIHIGFHKTGTTFIQNHFRNNREWWQGHSLLFPATGYKDPEFPTHSSATRGHGHLASVLSKAGSKKRAALWAALREEAAACGCHDVLLSSEIFAAPGSESVTDALTDLIGPDDSARVIVYFRRQDLWIESLYKEILGWSGRRETRDIETFLDEEGDNWLNYEARVAPWVERFGRENIIAKSYDDLVTSRGILRDFLDCLNRDTEPPAERSESNEANPSVDSAMVDFLRAANTLEGLSRANKAALTRTLLDPVYFPNPSRASLLKDALWHKLRDAYAPMNERLSATVMSGPTERFQFPEERPQHELATQRLTFETSKRLLEILNREEQPRPDTQAPRLETGKAFLRRILSS